MKLKKMVMMILAVGLCTSCSTINEDSVLPESTGDTIVMTENLYTAYSNAVQNAAVLDSYTITVVNSYEMRYSDSTMSAYDLDGVLEVSDAQRQPVAHYTTNINSNGLRYTLEGFYVDGRTYNTYNGVQYYEDMTLTSLQQIMLVPVRPIVIAEDVISEMQGREDSLGNISYDIAISDTYVKDVFLSRYDQYGLDQFDDLQVTSGLITDTFDTEGHFIAEETTFQCTITLSGETVDVTYHANASYTNINDTSLSIDAEALSADTSYVAYDSIDVSQMETLSSDDDSAEDTTTATFEKRIVSRLNYVLQQDGTYLTSFNNDNESYSINFAQNIFTYSNRTIHYIYNWKSDAGIMGACTVDFENGIESTDCVDTTVETIKEVKSWLQMELYYCGLTLEDLQKEAK